jgi:hypothetical protein
MSKKGNKNISFVMPKIWGNKFIIFSFFLIVAATIGLVFFDETPANAPDPMNPASLIDTSKPKPVKLHTNEKIETE